MAKSGKKGKQNNVLYLILGLAMIGFAVFYTLMAYKSSYDKATIQEVVRTYDKKSSGSSKRKYYADVVVGVEYKGEKVTANTTVNAKSERNLPRVGDVIDVQITEDGRVNASSKGGSLMTSGVAFLGGALLLWFSISNMIQAKKNAVEPGDLDSNIQGS